MRYWKSIKNGIIQALSQSASCISAIVICLTVGATRGECAPTQDIGALLQQFVVETDRFKKEKILRAIVQLPDAGPRLLDLARSSEDVNTKWLAVRGLDEVKYAPAGPFLIQALTHPHPWVRANAARALGDTGIHDAISPLITALLSEENGGVIEQVSAALTELNATNGVPALKLTAARRPAMKSAQTRLWLIEAIGQLGSSRDVPFLGTFLEDSDSVVGMAAAGGIERLTCERFGFLGGEGPQEMVPEALMRARAWWKQNKGHFRVHGKSC